MDTRYYLQLISDRSIHCIVDGNQRDKKANCKETFVICMGSFFKLFFAVSLVAVVYFIGLNHGVYLSENEKSEDVKINTEFIRKAASYLKFVPFVPEVDLPINNLGKEEEVKVPNGPGGPDLWNAVNTRRTELGQKEIILREDLCTIAAIRLSELLKIGALDGHDGFNKLTEERSDIQNIISGYGAVFEYLAKGGKTSKETIGLWENSLGHSRLLKGGRSNIRLYLCAGYICCGHYS